MPPTNTGERFERYPFQSATGTLAAELYTPTQAHRGMPLIVMLHGCTQTAGDFATGTGMNRLAGEQGCFVLYPEQSRKVNAQGCWNWFDVAHQSRNRGEPALIAGITRQLIQEKAIDPAQVYIAGLSAGGAMAGIVAECYPDIFSAVGIHSGLPPGAASTVSEAFSAMRGRALPTDAPTDTVRTIVFHGSADRTVSPANADLIRERLLGTSDEVTRERHEIRKPGKRNATVTRQRAADERMCHEFWRIHGGGHAWAGGNSHGTHTDPEGPDASAAMMRFFLQPTDDAWFEAG